MEAKFEYNWYFGLSLLKFLHEKYNLSLKYQSYQKSTKIDAFEQK